MTDSKLPTVPLPPAPSPTVMFRDQLLYARTTETKDREREDNMMREITPTRPEVPDRASATAEWRSTTKGSSVRDREEVSEDA